MSKSFEKKRKNMDILTKFRITRQKKKNANQKITNSSVVGNDHSEWKIQSLSFANKINKLNNNNGNFDDKHNDESWNILPTQPFIDLTTDDDEKQEKQINISKNNSISTSSTSTNDVSTSSTSLIVNNSIAIQETFDVEDECAICMENVKVIKFFPCKHTLICEKCFLKHKFWKIVGFLCPLCKTHVLNYYLNYDVDDDDNKRNQKTEIMILKLLNRSNGMLFFNFIKDYINSIDFNEKTLSIEEICNIIADSYGEFFNLTNPLQKLIRKPRSNNFMSKFNQEDSSEEKNETLNKKDSLKKSASFIISNPNAPIVRSNNNNNNNDNDDDYNELDEDEDDIIFINDDYEDDIDDENDIETNTNVNQNYLSRNNHNSENESGMILESEDKDIVEYPLLTVEQVQELFDILQKKNYFKEKIIKRKQIIALDLRLEYQLVSLCILPWKLTFDISDISRQYHANNMKAPSLKKGLRILMKNHQYNIKNLKF